MTDNMGCMTIKRILTFGQEVLRNTGLKKRGWKMDITKCSSGLCCHELKTFCVPFRTKNDWTWVAKEYVLHETAHALSGNQGNRHNSKFYRAFIRLLKQFMVDRKEPNDQT